MRTAEPIELSSEALQEPVASCDAAISCLARLSVQSGGAARIEAARKRIDLAGETLPLSRLVTLAAELGLKAERVELDWQALKMAVSAHPLLIVRNNTDVVVVTGGGRSGAEEVSVWDPHHDGVVFFVSRDDFKRTWSGYTLLITPVYGGTNIRDTSPQPRTPSRRSQRLLGLSLGAAATAIVATAGIALFLFTQPSARQVAGPSAPALLGSGPANRAGDAAHTGAPAP